MKHMKTLWSFLGLVAALSLWSCSSSSADEPPVPGNQIEKGTKQSPQENPDSTDDPTKHPNYKPHGYKMYWIETPGYIIPAEGDEVELGVHYWGVNPKPNFGDLWDKITYFPEDKAGITQIGFGPDNTDYLDWIESSKINYGDNKTSLLVKIAPNTTDEERSVLIWVYYTENGTIYSALYGDVEIHQAGK